MNSETKNKTYQFSSSLPITIYYRPEDSDFQDWQLMDEGPGYFTIPDHTTIGIRIKSIEDDEFATLIEETAQFPLLSFLDLSENRKLSNKGISKITSLQNLTHLNLRSCGINHHALEHLVELPFLEYLDLSFCNRITDHGIQYLQSMKNLKFIDLQGTTKITAAGIKRLQRDSLIIHK